MDKRSIISSESLKRVILQLDFSGLMEESLVEWINKNREFFGKIFSRFDKAERGSVRLDLSHPERFTMENGPDVREVNKGTLYLFQKGCLEGLKDQLRLEISNHRIVLTIDCIAYENSEPYLEYLSNLWESLSQHDGFVRFNSLGIRKLDLFDFKDEYALLENISPMTMNFSLWNNGKDFLERTFQDRYIFDANEVHAIVLDYVRHLRFVSKEGDNEKGVIQVIVDMDSRHYNKLEPRLTKDEIKNILKGMNDRLYSFFEKSVTSYYIQNHEKQIG